MGAKVEIEWTAQAVADLDSIYSYVLLNWSKKEADAFLDVVREFQDIIAAYPNASIRSLKRKAYRLGLIHRNVSAVYKIDPERITIIALVDNRSKSKYR